MAKVVPPWFRRLGSSAPLNHRRRSCSSRWVSADLSYFSYAVLDMSWTRRMLRIRRSDSRRAGLVGTVNPLDSSLGGANEARVCLDVGFARRALGSIRGRHEPG